MKVTPDIISLDHDGNLITKTISEKNKMVVLINNKNGRDDDTIIIITTRRRNSTKPSNSYSIIKMPKSNKEIFNQQ